MRGLADRRGGATVLSTTQTPKTAARDLRRTCWDGTDGATRFPVEPAAIAYSLGIDVHVVELEPTMAGFIIKDDVDAAVEIYLNSADADTTRRATGARLLGHFKLQHEHDLIGFVDRRERDAGPDTPPARVWAGRFADELLMPSAVVLEDWATAWAPSRMQRKFGVSLEALAARLAHLGLI